MSLTHTPQVSRLYFLTLEIEAPDVVGAGELADIAPLFLQSPEHHHHFSFGLPATVGSGKWISVLVE